MNFTETETLEPDDLPLGALADYLRLGRGFADDGSQDGVLEACLRGAVAAIEARTGKALITRGFDWVLYGWRDRQVQVLPIAPVVQIDEILLTDADGTVQVLDSGRYRLEQDRAYPRLVAQGGLLPWLGGGATATIRLRAGFGPWADLPGDLRQAVLLLAADFFENRNDMDRPGGVMPVGVMALLGPWRTLRLGGGAAA